MGNITTDFISATKKIHADVRAVLTALHLIREDVKFIRDQSATESNGEETEEEHPSKLHLNAPKKDHNSYAAKQYALDEQRFGLEKKAFWVGTGTLVFVAMYTGLSGIQSCESKRSADAAVIAADAAKGAANIAQQALTVQNRAWIEPRIEPPWDTDSQADLFKLLPQLDKLTFNIRFTNIGKIPAKNLRGDFGVEVLKNTEVPALNYPGIHQGTIFSTILYPNRGETSPAVMYVAGAKAGDPNAAVQTVSPDLREELQRGDKYIAVYVNGNFDDAFGKHWFRYCKWMAFSVVSQNYNSRKCVGWNDSGEFPNNTK